MPASKIKKGVDLDENMERIPIIDKKQDNRKQTSICP